MLNLASRVLPRLPVPQAPLFGALRKSWTGWSYARRNHLPGNICEAQKSCWAEADGSELGIPRSTVGLKTAEIRKHRFTHR